MTNNALDRSNVAWMILSIGLVTLPHVERLPIWISLIGALVLAWRL